jgi:hypothetical protein
LTTTSPPHSLHCEWGRQGTITSESVSSLNGRRCPVCPGWAPVAFRLRGVWAFFARL